MNWMGPFRYGQLPKPRPKNEAEKTARRGDERRRKKRKKRACNLLEGWWSSYDTGEGNFLLYECTLADNFSYSSRNLASQKPRQPRPLHHLIDQNPPQLLNHWDLAPHTKLSRPPFLSAFGQRPVRGRKSRDVEILSAGVGRGAAVG